MKTPLGLISLVSLVVANMIGAGVFTTSGFALADLGSAHRVMLAWLIGGVIALCGALSYAGLVRRITESGGEYVFLARLVHPVAGFVAGWVSLLAGFTAAIAFAALAFETYAAALFPAELPDGGLAILVIVLAAVLHGLRVETGAVAQNAVVILKLGLIGAFLVYAGNAGISDPPATVPAPVEPVSFGAFAGALVWISLSYSGFNAAVYVAGEATEARINVPRALWLGTLLVTFLYIALNAVFVYLPPAEAVANRPDVAAAAALAIGGEPAALAVRSVIGLALVTSVFSMVMAGPRVYARMAEDGLFPRVFRYRGRAPRSAIALQAGLAVVVVLVADLKELLSYLGFTLSLSAAATVSALFLVRRREGPAAAPVTGYPVTPALFIGATLVFAVLAARRNPTELAAAVITIVSGCAVFYLLRAWSSSRSM